MTYVPPPRGEPPSKEADKAAMAVALDALFDKFPTADGGALAAAMYQGWKVGDQNGFLRGLRAGLDQAARERAREQGD